MPDQIEIDASHVEGLVVVGGYTQEAERGRSTSWYPPARRLELPTFACASSIER